MKRFEKIIKNFVKNKTENEFQTLTARKTIIANFYQDFKC